MPYQVDFLENEGILLGQWNEDFDFKQEIHEYNQGTLAILNAQTSPIYFIHVFKNVNLSLQDIMTGASLATRSEQSTFSHPMVKRVILVTDNRALKVAAKGLNSVTFGNIEVVVYETLESALAFARSQAA